MALSANSEMDRWCHTWPRECLLPCGWHQQGQESCVPSSMLELQFLPQQLWRKIDSYIHQIIYVLYVYWALCSYVHLTGGSLTMFVFISSWLLDKGKHSRVRITNNILSIVFSPQSLMFAGRSHWQDVVLLPRLSDKLDKISIITSRLNCHESVTDTVRLWG